MLSPVIPLMQIRELKRSLNPQLGCKGAVIHIPVEVNEMLDVLPRQFNDMSVLQLKLKRHREQKTDYLFETTILFFYFYF